MGKLKLLLAVLILSINLAGCGGFTEIKTVEATVYDLQFKEEYREKVVERDVKEDWDGNVIRDFFGNPVYEESIYYRNHPAEYWVFLEYDGLTCKINNEEIFRLVEKGGTVKASIYERYDNNGKLISRKLGKYQSPTTDKNREKIRGLNY